MIVRPLGKHDFDHLVQVVERCWGEALGGEVHPIHPIFFHELGGLAHVAERRGAILGFILAFLIPEGPPTGYVHFVGVHPDHRRRGIGTTLYQTIEERCIDRGCANLRAVAAPENQVALEFHLGNAWQVTHAADYAGPARPRLVFTKSIP